jgi:hypothetical protein
MRAKIGLTHKGKNKDRLFENRLPKRIFVPKRNDVTESWKNMHTEELHNL